MTYLALLIATHEAAHYLAALVLGYRPTIRASRHKLAIAIPAAGVPSRHIRLIAAAGPASTIALAQLAHTPRQAAALTIVLAASALDLRQIVRPLPTSAQTPTIQTQQR